MRRLNIFPITRNNFKKHFINTNIIRFYTKIKREHLLNTFTFIIILFHYFVFRNMNVVKFYARFSDFNCNQFFMYLEQYTGRGAILVFYFNCSR